LCNSVKTQCNTTPVSSKAFFVAPTTKHSHLTRQERNAATAGASARKTWCFLLLPEAPEKRLTPFVSSPSTLRSAFCLSINFSSLEGRKGEEALASREGEKYAIDGSAIEDNGAKAALAATRLVTVDEEVETKTWLSSSWFSTLLLLLVVHGAFGKLIKKSSTAVPPSRIVLCPAVAAHRLRMRPNRNNNSSFFPAKRNRKSRGVWKRVSYSLPAREGLEPYL
jgi:hypothetical protein